MENNKMDDAKRDFEKTLEINPKYAPAASILAVCISSKKTIKSIGICQ
ncbi:MAG: hypothetical protein R2779_06145 [Crocinitomicaceae bacterium]